MAQEDLDIVQEYHLESLGMHSRRCNCGVRAPMVLRLATRAACSPVGRALRWRSCADAQVMKMRQRGRMGAHADWQASGKAGRAVGAGLRP